MDRELDPRTIRNRRLRRTSIAVAGVVLALGAWWTLPGLVRPSVRLGDVRTARVERGPVRAMVQASGTVLPAFEHVMSSPVAARVLDVLHRPGETVATGDVILELDTTATRLALERAADELARKQSERRRLELDLQRDLAGLRSRIEAARLDVELLDYRLRQQRQLHDDGLTSENALRQAEVEQRKAELALSQLEEEERTTRRTNAEELEAQDREIALLLRERDEAGRQLELARARADRDGVLTWVVEEEGSLVQPGDLLARIADLGSFRIEATLSDAYASRVAAGQPVEVRVEGRLLKGRVTGVRPMIEAGAARFDVALDDPSDVALRQNRRVDVFVVTETREDVLRLAKGPGLRSGRVQQVFVVRGDDAVRVDAEFGVSGLDFQEVLFGLDEGDEVIVSSVEDWVHMKRIGVRGAAPGKERG